MSGSISRTKLVRLALGLTVLVALVAGGILLLRNSEAPGKAVQEEIREAGVPVPSAKESPSTEPHEKEVLPKTEFDWARELTAARDSIPKGADATRAFVLELFAKLDRMTPDARLGAVMSFFDSGQDVRFGNRFTVGTGGFLSDWPTLRVALLDYLSQRDGTAARALAELLLQTRPAEAGEWTLALRELVRGQSFEDLPPGIVGKIHDFIGDEAWARNSTASWLEGFDVIVATKSPSFLPDLSVTAQSSNASRAAQFAAFLASDRMMLASPVDVMKELNEDASLFASQPNVRAGLFARADVRDPEQLGLLESYFQRPDISSAERENFAGLFPLYDLAVSKNLLTSVPSRSMADMIAHDRATEILIDRWLARPDLSQWDAAFRDIKARLDQQLADAGR